MSKKKDLVVQEEIDKCLSYISNDKPAQEQLLMLLQQMQITIDEPVVEDSIDGTRIHVTYTPAISRTRGGIDENNIRFQCVQEILIDHSKVPIRLRDDNMTATASAVDDDSISHNDNANAEDTLIESYDALEKDIPALYEVLGLSKRIYFTPEDFLTG